MKSRVRKAIRFVPRRTLIVGSSLILLAGWGSSPSSGQIVGVTETLEQQKIPFSEEALRDGEALYFERCSFCHGLEGKGDGPVAPYILPRPRDFTAGLFRLRTTRSGELPTDEDLYWVITNGVPGNAMPAWGEGELVLSERERWALVHFIKQFNPDFTDEAFDPYEYLVRIDRAPSITKAMVEQGSAIYHDPQQGGCVRCHGALGRGDGEQAGELVEDEYRDRIFPADLTKGWLYKNEATLQGIFRSLSTGFNGTPMPGYGEILSEDERWSLAAYIQSLVAEVDTGRVLLISRFIDGELPTAPDDPRWQETDRLDVSMSGQLIAAPRHQNHTVDMMHVRSVYNTESIAFHLSWNDRFENLTHDEQQAAEYESDPPLFIKPADLKRGAFRDSVALQFPAGAIEGTARPYLLWGQSGRPVNLWTWYADRQEPGATGPVAEEFTAKGWEAPWEPQGDAGQSVTANGQWEEGQWQVVFLRPLRTDDKDDIQLARGSKIPVAFFAWDGSNGETGLICSHSSWYFLQLEAPVAVFAYISGFLGIGIAGAIEVLLIRWARKRQSRQGEGEGS